MYLALAFLGTLTALDAAPAQAVGPLAPSASGTVQATPGGDQDWILPAGTVTFFNTVSSVVNGKLVLGGVVGVHDLHVEPGAVLVVDGPNPFVLTASGSVLIEGLIDVSGVSSPGVNSLNTTSIPEPGAPGRGGGGRGGTGSPLTAISSPEGGPGLGAFGSSLGGGFGGETGWSSTSVVNQRRGAGGGGGRFGPDVLDQSRIGLDAEPGFDNLQADNGAFSGSGPAHGGAVGLAPFVDGDRNNDFFGVKLERATGELVAGELRKPWAGAGGGGGGDAARVPLGMTFPAPFNPQGDEKGAGGGGGGGSLHVMALGPITFGPSGQVKARGGTGGGGENTIFLNRVGGGSGGGSGGHVILESAARIDLSASLGNALIATGGQGGAGRDDLGGAFVSNVGIKETSPSKDACPPGFTGCLGHVDGAGGDGSPGLIQLHVPPADGAFGNLVLPNGVSLAELSFPLPVGAGTGSQLLPTFDTGGTQPLFQAAARRLASEDLRFRPELGFGPSLGRR